MERAKKHCPKFFILLRKSVCNANKQTNQVLRVLIRKLYNKIVLEKFVSVKIN